ncbi:3-oxoacyl-(acyl-carrier-protein) synthase, KASII [Candidatus Desulfosporosinus infrequens]|uniref:3-oxoacyl-(Acyl-carrier-protein) synthase, KASII n=1 Tax=Candidatus Desulfosporosinus infrequens TaxID=2043169 RepID=A0A2U3KMB5_9FIRM|nr:3-oxoacyl-(acyl-carrier-protein) synthase, KASII [Candidatus Desulfosporosinus infrequens]
MKERVVVTGMGVISSIGKNINEFTASLKVGRSGIGRIYNAFDPPISVSIAAEIQGISFDAYLEGCAYSTEIPPGFTNEVKQCARRAPFAVQGSITAAIEAWSHAQLFKNTLAPERVGIIIAGNNLTEHYQYGLYEKFKQTPEYLSPTYALHYLDTDQVGILSQIFKIRGEGFTVGGASASGNIGILKGFQLIQLGLVDVCMVIGSMAHLSPMELQGFYNIGAMGGKRFINEPEKACRPFDREHEGFIYGQASGCLVLESFKSASAREVSKLAEISGGALVLDGNHLSDPNEAGEIRAMETALNQALIDTYDVNYINTHGTSSPKGDEIELKAIRKVFKRKTLDIWINATKALTGHCLYSAGVIEAIATIIQMNEGFVHPNINLDNPIESDFKFSGKELTKASIPIALSNSFGFGGINTSIVLQKVK